MRTLAMILVAFLVACGGGEHYELIQHDSKIAVNDGEVTSDVIGPNLYATAFHPLELHFDRLYEKNTPECDWWLYGDVEHDTLSDRFLIYNNEYGRKHMCITAYCGKWDNLVYSECTMLTVSPRNFGSGKIAVIGDETVTEKYCDKLKRAMPYAHLDCYASENATWKSWLSSSYTFLIDESGNYSPPNGYDAVIWKLTPKGETAAKIDAELYWAEVATKYWKGVQHAVVMHPKVDNGTLIKRKLNAECRLKTDLIPANVNDASEDMVINWLASKGLYADRWSPFGENIFPFNNIALGPAGIDEPVLTIGKRYLVTGFARGDGARLSIGGNELMIDPSTRWQHFIYEHTAGSENFRFSSAGQTTIDELSVRPIILD